MTVRVGDPELVLDPYDYDFHEDPYPYYRRLRDEAPLYRNEERNFWAVSRHHDVLQGFRDSTALSNAYGVSLDPSSRTSEAYRVMSMLAMDDPAHLRMRTLVSKGFTPRRIRELEPQVLELARIHLDSALQTESFDFVAEFAGKLPMDVISELIGVPDTDRARIRALADAVLHREDGVADVPPPAMAASIELMRYYADLIAEFRRRPANNLTSALLAAELDGDRLSDQEIMAFLFLMVIAGKRDHHQATGQCRLLGRPPPWPAGPRIRRPLPDSDVGGGNPALRHVQPDSGPHRRARSHVVRHHDPRG